MQTPDSDMNNPETNFDVAGAVRGITKNSETENLKSQKMLRGMLTRDQRAINYDRAITALDTGDPQGLEALDFGSVRGKPAVSFITKNGERRVLTTTMPTYLAALKSRTVMREAMREKVKSDMEREAATQELSPSFTRALDGMRGETGELFTNLALRSFRMNPTDTAAMVSDLQRKFRTNRVDAEAEAKAFIQGEQLKISDQLANSWGSHFKNRASLEKSDPSRVAQLQSQSERINRIQMITKDTPANINMSLTQRMKSNAQFANMVLNDMFSLLEEGVSLPGGGEARLGTLDTANELSVQQYIQVFERFLRSTGMIAAPLTIEDKATLLRQGMARTGTLNAEALPAAVEFLRSQAQTQPMVSPQSDPGSDRTPPASAPAETPEQRRARLVELANQAREEAGGGSRAITEKARIDPEFRAKYAEILRGG